eukprot:15024-Pyramimonas_sp.AAC.1
MGTQFSSRRFPFQDLALLAREKRILHRDTARQEAGTYRERHSNEQSKPASAMACQTCNALRP